MKNRIVLSISVLFLLCFLFSCTQGPTDLSSEITKANLEFVKLYNSGDANALSLRYTTNARLYPPNSEAVEGHIAIEELWNSVMEMGVRKLSIEIDTVVGYGKVAIEEGKYKLYTEGDLLIDEGKYIVIWHNVNGQWMLHQDIWNTNIPIPIPPVPEEVIEVVD